LEPLEGKAELNKKQSDETRREKDDGPNVVEGAVRISVSLAKLIASLSAELAMEVQEEPSVVGVQPEQAERGPRHPGWRIDGTALNLKDRSKTDSNERRKK
jgi:hypothetical protein